jgi:hypothetical protein
MPTTPQSWITALKQRRRINNLRVIDLRVHALCCDICGANSTQGQHSKYASFDWRGVRAHLLNCHNKQIFTEDQILQRCKGTPISVEDLRCILEGTPSKMDERIKTREAPRKPGQRRGRAISARHSTQQAAVNVAELDSGKIYWLTATA